MDADAGISVLLWPMPFIIATNSCFLNIIFNCSRYCKHRDRAQGTSFGAPSSHRKATPALLRFSPGHAFLVVRHVGKTIVTSYLRQPLARPIIESLGISLSAKTARGFPRV